MMAAHLSLDDVRNWPIFPRLSAVGLAYGLGKVATNDRISRSRSSCFDANMYPDVVADAILSVLDSYREIANNTKRFGG